MAQAKSVGVSLSQEKDAATLQEFLVHFSLPFRATEDLVRLHAAEQDKLTEWYKSMCMEKASDLAFLYTSYDEALAGAGRAVAGSSRVASPPAQAQCGCDCSIVFFISGCPSTPVRRGRCRLPPYSRGMATGWKSFAPLPGPQRSKRWCTPGRTLCASWTTWGFVSLTPMPWPRSRENIRDLH